MRSIRFAVRLRRLCAAAALLALFAAPQPARANVTYRPGLMQAKITLGSPNGLATQSGVVPVLASNLLAAAATDDKMSVERAPGTLMDVSVGDGPGSIANNITGNASGWTENYIVFAYEGQMHVTAGTTYKCYGRFDDGEAAVIDGTIAVHQGSTSGYNGEPATLNDYTASATGWVPFNAWVWDWTGGKNVIGGLYALQYNTSGVSDDFSNPSVWSRFRDDGSMTFLRTDTGDTFTTIVSAVPDGDNLQLNVSFTNVPAAATLVAFFGDHDRGASSNNWTSSFSLGPVAAGDTATKPFVVSNAASARYLRLRLDNPTKTAGDTTFSSVFEEWTDPVNRNNAPEVSLSLSSIAYTNAVYEAEVSSFGFGSTFCDLVLEISRNDSFDPIDVSVSTSGVDSSTVVFPVPGLVTNTAYYARVIATAPATGEVSTTDALGPRTTLLPTAAAGTVELASIGYSTADFLWTPTALGDDSSWADLTLELSTDSGFSSLVREVPLGRVFADGLGTTHEAALEGLSGATTYYARVRLENEWGFVSYSGTVSGRTDNRSFGISDVGYVDEGDVRTISVALTWLDCPEVTAVLWYGDRRNPFGDAYLVGTNTLSSTGLFNWTVPSESSGTRYVRIVASGVVNGETGTRTITATIAPGTKSIILGGVSAYTTADAMLRLHEGDRAVLPPLAGKAFYESLADRVATVEGEVLVAEGPGMAAVRAYDATGANPTTFGVLVLPREPRGGTVYVMRSGATAWNDAASWTDASGANVADWPRRAADIAMIPGWGADKTVTVSGDVSLRELYVGGVGETGYTVRIQGSGSPTLTLSAPGRLKSAVVRICSNATAKDKHLVLRLGGSAASGKLNVAVPSAKGVEFDNGASLDETYGSDALNFGNAQLGFDFADVSVAAGAELVFTHGNPNGGDSVDMTSRASFAGDGVIASRTAGQIVQQSDFSAFAGTLRAGGRAASGNFAWHNYDSLHWIRSPGGMPLASLDVAGYFTGNDNTSAGFLSSGCSHSYYSQQPHNNEWPAGPWTLEGGDVLMLWEWREFPEGTFLTNRTSELRVERGLTALQLVDPARDLAARIGSTDNGTSPTNWFRADSLSHPGKGTVLWVNYESMSLGNTARSRAEIDGIENFLEGNEGDGSPSDGYYRIIPWMAVPNGGDVTKPSPVSVDEDGRLAGPKVVGGNLCDTAKPGRNGAMGNGDGIMWLESSDKRMNSFVWWGSTKMNNQWFPAGSGNWYNNYGWSLISDCTLTLEGGALCFWKDNSYFGHQPGYQKDPKICGHLRFPKTAYIWSSASEAGAAEIWSDVIAPEGLVNAYWGALRLGGVQTNIEDSITVNAGTLILGSATDEIPTIIKVPVYVVGGNSKLRLDVAGSFTTHEATLNLEDVGGYPARVEMNVDDTVWEASVDGVTLQRGTWGSSGSGADHVDDAHFLGTGVLTVLHDQLLKPTTMILR